MTGTLLRWIQPRKGLIMQKRKTYFEQVPVEVVEKVLEKTATLAAIRETSEALFSGFKPESAPVSSKRRQKFPRKVQR